MLILGVLLILSGGCVTLANWMLVYEWYRRKYRSSQIPLIGGLCLALGLYCVTNSIYSFLLFFADPGCIVFLCGIPLVINACFQTSIFRLLHYFRAQSDTAAYSLKFFKGGIFRIEISFDPPQDCNEHGAKILADNMDGKWLLENNYYVLTNYRDDRQAILEWASDSTYILQESNYPESKQYKYDSLNNIQFELVHSKNQNETT